MTGDSDANGAVLVVEDDKRIREPLGILLRAAGYVVNEAVDGIDALGKFRAALRAPSAILLDLEMPRLDGRGFLRELSAAPRSSMMLERVVLMSGSSELAWVASEFRLRRYLSKPFAADQVLDAIASLLARRG